MEIVAEGHDEEVNLSDDCTVDPLNFAPRSKHCFQRNNHTHRNEATALFGVGTSTKSRKTQIYDLTIDEPDVNSLYLDQPPLKCSQCSLTNKRHPTDEVLANFDCVECNGFEGTQMSHPATDRLADDSSLSRPSSINNSFSHGGDPISLNQAPSAFNESERIMSYDLTNDEQETESLDFPALMDLMEGSDIPSQINTNSRSKGPICCNSWCSFHAEIIPTENVRDYFGIPRGKSYKICRKCKDQYDSFSEAAMMNFVSGGDMLELQCAHRNDFCVLEDEQASDDCTYQSDEHQDIEVEKLLRDAIAESFLEIASTTSEAIDRSKEQVLFNLENFIKSGELLVSRIQKVDVELDESFSVFKNQFERKVVALPELDIPLPEVELDSFNFENDEDSCASIQCIEPIRSKLTGKAPEVKDTVYCMPTSQTTEWCEFIVERVDINCVEDVKIVETFTLVTTVNGAVLEKVVGSDAIALFDPPCSQIGVGRRVIARYNNSGIDIAKRFLAGMISELPSEMNRFRYLVFFDEGHVQYCPHSDVRLVYKINKPVYEYFTGGLSTLAMEYLCNFPETKMFVVEVGQRIRLDKNGFRMCSRVERVDASLVLVTYLHNNESEWLYRGSPRLRPIFGSTKGAHNGVINRSQVAKKLSVSRIVNQLIDITKDDDDEDISDASQLPCESQLAIQEQAVSALGKHRTRGAAKKNVNVHTKLPPNMLIPLPFRVHSCSVSCVSWVRYDPVKCKGVSLLAIPSIFGFKRKIVSNYMKYVAPCGVVLSNMQHVLEYLSLTLMPLTLDMFSFSLAINIFHEWIPHPRHVVTEDISFGAENVPIPCINEIDCECPGLMSYITERRPHDGVFINQDPGFLISCDCTDNCANRSVCSCWKLNVECFSALNLQGIPLTEIGYQYQRLKEVIPSGIYECNINCKCRATCINRVVQQPLKNKLQLFKTPKAGWGVRCLNDIPKGTFICTYVATVYTEEMGNEIGKVRGDEYLAELDHIETMENLKEDFESDVDDASSQEGASKEKEQSSASKKAKKSVKVRETEAPSSLRRFYGPNESPYILDAKLAGNIGRFFNHSCSPNMFVQNVLVDSHDLRFPWVAYFASKDILAGSELTWNYCYAINSVPGKILFCECDSPNCVKRLL